LDALVRTEDSIKAKTASSRERLEVVLAKVGDAMKKLTTMKDQLGHLTARVAELKRLKERLEAAPPQPLAAPPEVPAEPA
jgi:chromosome segregation ATPase